LYDVRKNLPDSIRIGSLTKRFTFAGTLLPGADINCRIAEIEMNIPGNALFDTIYLNLQKGMMPDGRETISLNSSSDVFFDYAKFIWTPQKPYDQIHTRIYSIDENNRIDDYVGMGRK
jgi:hypothetical protein